MVWLPAATPFAAIRKGEHLVAVMASSVRSVKDGGKRGLGYAPGAGAVQMALEAVAGCVCRSWWCRGMLMVLPDGWIE